MQAAPALVSKQAVAAPAVTTQAVAATTPNVQTSWFTYDADNRVLVSNGALVNGQVVITAGTYTAPSVGNQYDAAGNVVLRSTINATTYSTSYGGTATTYLAGDLMSQRLIYDARNELVESDYAVDVTEHPASLGAQQRQSYDADGRLLTTSNYLANNVTYAVKGTHDVPNGYVYVPIGGWLTGSEVSVYNADGQTLEQVSFVSPLGGYNWLSIANQWEDSGNLPNGGQGAMPTYNSDGSVATDGPLAIGSTTHYTGFDHADNVTTYSYSQSPMPGAPGSDFGASYQVNYLRKDSYLEQSTTGTPAPGVTGYVPATDTSYYDAFGRRIAVSQTSQSNSGAVQNTTRVFGDDTGGEIVQKRSGTLSGSTFTPSGGGATDHYTYAEGQALSVLDEAGDISALTALTGFSDGPGTQGYVVQAGDTLASIAQAVYGNGQLGYLIAQANGFSGDGDLVQGQSITVPSVTTSSNSATTFKPYNASAIVGSTTPTLPTAPPPPPPSSHGCSTFAEILVVAVTVVASIYTAGAAGDAGWGYLASGAAAGAAGSTAGQLAGDVLGVHQGFDLGEVAEGAVGGVIGGELSGTFSQGGALADTFSSTVGNGINPLGNALIGASSYGGTYETAKITGEAAHFSWAGLVADAAGSAAGGEFGSTSAQTAAGLQDGFSASQVAARAVQDLVTRETSRALGDDHTQSWQQIGEDLFGNALGNAAVAGLKAYQANQLPAVNASQTPITIAQPTASVVVGDMPQTITAGIVEPVQLSAYTVQPGDTLSDIAGTSDPATIGMLMRLNDLTSSAIQPGMVLQLGDGSAPAAQDQQAGQVVLDQDNATRAMQASNSAALAQLANLPVSGLVDSFAKVGSSATVGGPFARYSLATAGTGVGSATEGTTSDEWVADPTNEVLIGMGKGLSNTPSLAFNAIQRIESWFHQDEGTQFQSGSVPGLLGAGEGEYAGSTALIAPTIAYSNSYQQIGGIFSGVSMLAIPGVGEADGGAMFANGMGIFARGGESAVGVLDASGGSFLDTFGTVPSAGTPINGATRTVPLGFNPESIFTDASQELQGVLVNSGINDAMVGVRGSSVTGSSFRTGAPFGPQSDIDFFIESQQLTDGYSTSQNIPGFVHPGKILPDYPLLQQWSTKWTNLLGRDVTLGAFAPGTVPNQPAILVH